MKKQSVAEFLRDLLAERGALKRQVADLQVALHNRDAVIKGLEDDNIGLRDDVYSLREAKTLLEEAREACAKALLEAGELHLADESDVYDLERRVAELEAEARWVPVTGEQIHNEDDCLLAEVENGGATIIVWDDGLEEPFCVPLYLPADIRLCRRQSQAVPAVPVPDWSQAPEWAQWWAIYPDGIAHWYRGEPLKIAAGWASKDHRQLDADYDIPLGIDWRTLKAQRQPQAPVQMAFAFDPEVLFTGCCDGHWPEA